MSIEAFAFRSPHDLPAMRVLLTNEGSIPWRGGDSDVWGAYLVARLEAGGGRLRIFADGDRFVVDISAIAGVEQLETTVRFVKDKLLLALEAFDVEPHPGWE